MDQETHKLNLKVPTDLRKQIGISAAQNLRSLSAEVTFRLRQAYETEEATPQK